MKSKNNFYFTLITPLMILIAVLGLIFRDSAKKKFYVPIGIIGFYLVVERAYHRRNIREDILNKIKIFQENK